jgi:hypothetical protein
MAITWSAFTLPASGRRLAGVWNGTLFVAPTITTNAVIAGAPGGAWSSYAVLPASASWDGIAYGLGKHVVVAATGVAAYSVDGISAYSSATMPSADSWQSVAFGADYGTGRFVTISDGLPTAYSDDGETFLAGGNLPTSEYKFALAYGQGKWATADWTGTTVSVTADGAATWTGYTIPSGDWSSMAYCPVLDLWVLVDYVSDTYLTATDPEGPWTSRTMPTAGGWASVIALPGGGFLALASDNTGNTDIAAVMSEAYTWELATLPAVDEWSTAIASPTEIVALGADATNGARGPYSPVMRITDGLAVTTTLHVDTVAVLSEALALTTAFSLSEINALVESLDLTSVAQGVAQRLATMTEALALNDSTGIILSALAADTFDLADEATPTRDVLVAMVDTLVVTGEATGTLTAIALVAEALAFAETVRLITLGEISDETALGETLDAKVSALEHLIAEAVFSDTATGLAQFTVIVDDTVSFDETATGTASLIAAIEDGLDFAVGFVFDNEPYVALSMNAATKALTSYTNYPFNSMASFNGQTYGASSEGLYRIGGATDAGAEITWKLRTGLTNFGTGRNKGLDAAYLGFTADGRVALKCIIVAPTGEKIAYWYELTGQTAENPLPKRLQMGRGLKSVYMGFELSNIDAGDIELDIIELHPIILDGRL